MTRRDQKSTGPIAVVGGTGRVGSALVTALLETGADVRILGRDPSKAKAAFPQAEAVEVDLEKPDSIRAGLDGTTVQSILGRPPLTVGEWLTDNIEKFR